MPQAAATLIKIHLALTASTFVNGILSGRVQSRERAEALHNTRIGGTYVVAWRGEV
jgi:hypothetical protein